ncbi:MAG: undecaprenyl/decaprenyl-phosphate alpha-N-acetylglucosaminyl 1-phosphate transferase [Chitinophagaceae bacterium]|nr:undecaprenyl/decaprenyl-phosphate alpha-N-acetylglucosaminyl 1-phosphate transferase [Chitinophagaceae bacterium]
MDHLLIGSVIAFLITFSAIPIIIRVAEMKHLFDLPDDRKVHANPVSPLGGIGIFAGFIMAFLISAPIGYPELQYYAVAFLLIFFLGLKDDIIVLTPLKKFLGQLLAAFIIVYKGGILIDGMFGFMGMEKMPMLISLVFTYLTIVVITNSFNLIDGVDGLAGSLGLFTTLAFGTYFLLAQQPVYSVMAFCMAGSMGAFLIFNISPAKIFMGDTGSLLLGIVNSILVIKFIQVATVPTATIYLPAAPAIGFAILFVPLFDTLRVFAFRILSRRSPFSPDRNHVHHLLLEKGCNHNMVTFLAVTFNILIAAATFMGRNINITFLLLGLISVGFSVISLLIYSNRNKRRKLFPLSFESKVKTVSETKIIPLKKGSAVHEPEEMAK